MVQKRGTDGAVIQEMSRWEDTYWTKGERRNRKKTEEWRWKG